MKVIVGLLALVAAVPATAQVPDHVNDMLRRIYASADFAPQRFGPARWIENGTAYTTVEKSAAMPDAFDIVRYETATGARSVYISARQLVPSGASEGSLSVGIVTSRYGAAENSPYFDASKARSR